MAREIDTIGDVCFSRAPSGFVIAVHDGDHYEVTIAQNDGDPKSLKVRTTVGIGEDMAEADLSAVEIFKALRTAVTKNPGYIREKAEAEAAEIKKKELAAK